MVVILRCSRVSKGSSVTSIVVLNVEVVSVIAAVEGEVVCAIMQTFATKGCIADETVASPEAGF